MRTIEEIRSDLIFKTHTIEEFIYKIDELVETVSTLQREKCAEKALLQQFEYNTDKLTLATGFYSISGNWITIDTDSILNAKL